MIILETLEGITDKMNELADRVPLGAQPAGVQSSGGQGLSGLGNINTDNANGQLESPFNQVQKMDTDSRKLVTNTERFTNNCEYKDYLVSWLSNTGVCTVTDNSNYITVNVNQQSNNQIISSSFEVFPVLNFNEVTSIIQSMTQVPIAQTAMPQGPMPQGPVSTTSRIIIGYINYSQEQIKFAKQSSIELVGANEILEINNAIDLGIKKMPYIAFDKKSFTHLFGSLLNRKYSDNTMGNGIAATFTQVTQNINNSMQNAGDSLGEKQVTTEPSGPLTSGVITLQNGVVNPDSDSVESKPAVSLEKVPETTENTESKVSLTKEP